MKKNQVLELTIGEFAFHGGGVAKIHTDTGDFTVFIDNTIPGQRVRARVTKVDKRHAVCKLEEVLTPSPVEQNVPWQPIPGAPYIKVPPALQIEWKKKNTLELFRRIGKIEPIESLFDTFISSPRLWHYRNKMEYSFSAIRYDLHEKKEKDEPALGFKHRGTWWMVEDLEKDSGLFDEQLETSLFRFKKWCIDSGLPFWHPPRQQGFFRYFIARKSFAEDRLLLNLVTTDTNIEYINLNQAVAFFQQMLGDRMAGFIHTINNEISDRAEPLHGSTHLLFGSPVIREKICGLDFEISMTSFFQTNPACAEKLYEKIVDYVTETTVEGSFILDLFCGTGTIGQLLAQGTKNKVIGVDIVASAIDDARRNAKKNKIENIDFFASDVGVFLSDHPEYNGRISTMVLDPPRGGITPKTLQKIMALQVPHIVYVSCNPATQARDAVTLSEKGYTLKKISLADQFPHTAHIESVALFSKMKSFF